MHLFNKNIKKVISYLLVVALFVITTAILANSISYESALTIYQNSNKGYLLLGVIAQSFYWVIDAIIIFIFTKNTYGLISFKECFRNSVIGTYYGLITPYQSGAQPAQIYHLGNKLKIPYGKATAIQLNKFVVYQTVITVIGIIVFTMKFGYLINKLHFAISFIIIGLLVHGGIGLVLLFGIFSPSFIHKAVVSTLKFIHRFKQINSLDLMLEKLDKYVEDFKNNVSLTKEDPKLIFYVVALTTIQTVVNFSITFFVYKALNLHGASYVEIFTLQTVLFLAVSSVPIPGSVGASEIGFYTILLPVFGNHLISYAIILWRGITYYFNIVITGIFVFVFHIVDKYTDRHKSF